MAPDTMPAPTAFETAAHDTLVASLRNTHALEKQAITVLDSQLKLLTEYPDLHARVTEHIVETREQARRLEAALEACGGSASMFKDALLSVMGLGQSSVQGFGDDAVLKAVLADMMTEHLEIGTYRMLLILADLAGKPELRPRLEETLREEEAMAEWFDKNLEAITRRHVEIMAAEERETEPTSKDEASTPEGEATPTLWQTLETASTSGAHPKTSTPDANRDIHADSSNANSRTETSRPREPGAPATDTVRSGN